jgi:hypothetical protein
MKHFQLTTRHCMVVVLAAALVCWWFPFLRQYRAYAHLEDTLLEFEWSQREYDVGRMLADRLLAQSERLMEAQLALNESKPKRIAAVNAHWSRTAEVLRVEREYRATALQCRGSNEPDIAMAEETLRKAQNQLNELRRSK